MYGFFISLSSLSLATDATDLTLGTSGLWLGMRTGTGGTATLVRHIFAAAHHDSIDNRATVSVHGVYNFAHN